MSGTTTGEAGISASATGLPTGRASWSPTSRRLFRRRRRSPRASTASSNGVPREARSSRTSVYRLRSSTRSTGRAADDTPPSGLFSFVLPFATTANRIELWKGAPGASGSLLLYAQNRTAPPQVTGLSVGIAPIGLSARPSPKRPDRRDPRDVQRHEHERLRHRLATAGHSRCERERRRRHDYVLDRDGAANDRADDRTSDDHRPGDDRRHDAAGVLGSADHRAVGRERARGRRRPPYHRRREHRPRLVINRFVSSGAAVNSPDGEAIHLETGDGNVIEGNYLGLDMPGVMDFGNHTGIHISGSSQNNTIGSGSGTSTRNYISGNNRYGIYVAGATNSGNVIENNFVGLNRSDAAVANNTGINFNFGDGNTVRNNWISGNAGGGIIISGGNGNTIQGNRIGTNPLGTIAIPNGWGIQILAGASVPASNNLIGGTGAGQVNVIAGNTGEGIVINSFAATSGTTGNQIVGNRIGVGETGGDLGNGREGINIAAAGGMDNTTIGGIAAGAGNIIGYNAGAGIAVDSANVRERILGNSIYSNDGLGIDLGATGVTPNDPGDTTPDPTTSRTSRTSEPRRRPRCRERFRARRTRRTGSSSSRAAMAPRWTRAATEAATAKVRSSSVART